MPLSQTDVEADGSGAWWLMRLGRKLTERWTTLETWWNWYNGDHPLPEGPTKATEAFRSFQTKAKSNLCKLPVKATVSRQTAIGITDAKGRADEIAWRWWQLNRLDSRQKLVYRTRGSQGWAYAMVGKHPRLAGEDGQLARPLISLETPREVIVETDAATGDRIAAFKLAWDDRKRRWRASVMVRDDETETATLYRFVTAAGVGSPDRAPSWVSDTWDTNDDDGAEEPLPQGIPVVEFPCITELGRDPAPLFADGLDVQDRINFEMLNRLTGSRYSAFRQKWVTGHAFKKTTDPMTGLDVVEPVFRPGPDNVWTSSGENTRFGEFSQIDVKGFLEAHASDIRDFVVMTSTPAYIASAQLVNVSTDTVQALDTLHLALVRELNLSDSESWEDVFGLCAKVAGRFDLDYSSAEMRWADPRSLNPAVLADAGTKLFAVGYPLEVIAERMGESPQQVQKITAAAAGQALLSATVNQPLQSNPGTAAPAVPAPTPETADVGG